MSTVVIGAMMALALVQQTDTVIPLEGRERLSVDAAGGTVIVGVWDRDEVRIRGEHSSRTYVEVETRRNTIEVESEARRGPANIVDYQITIPRTLALSVDGQFTDITIEGADGEVEAETVQGDITIRGGRGSVQASSANGVITVEGAEGRIEIESAGADIVIRDSAGDLLAESAGGDVIMENVSATSVDAGSVGGRVYFDGTFQPSGTYFFGSHGGSVTIVVPETTAASFNVASVHGSVTSNLTGSPERFERGQRHSFDLNGGGALVEAETFGGRIQLLRKGTEGEPPRPRRERRDHGSPKGLEDAFGYADVQPEVSIAVTRAMALAQPRIDVAVERAMALVAPRLDLAVETAVDVSMETVEATRIRRPATIRR